MENTLLPENIEIYKNSIAKSSGLTLYQHTQNLLNVMSDVVTLRENTFDKWVKHTFGNKLSCNVTNVYNDLKKCIVYHDYGKSNPRWQTSTDNIKLVGFRHEIDSLVPILKQSYESWNEFEEHMVELSNIILPIVSHHNNLSEQNMDKFNSEYNNERIFKLLKEIDVKNTSDIFVDLDKYLINSTDNLFSYDNGEVWDFWYKNSLNRHFLKLIDRRASAIENGNTVIDMNCVKNNFYQLPPHMQLRNLQTICKESNDNLLLLRAPTGSGKTKACLLWANNQFKNGVERIIITMPTQFTSNALADAIKLDLENNNDIYVQHSTKKFDYTKDEYYYSKTFEPVVNVSTIDQVLTSLTLLNEERHTKLFNVINSCIVIDESDFYDSFIQANIIELLKLCKHFNVPVMMMSATLPNSFVSLINRELGVNIQMIDDNSDSDRTRVSIENIITNEFDYFGKIDNVIHKKTAIVYCNTIERAKTVYKYIKKNSSRDDVVLYHSEFTKTDKRLIEGKIISLLGETAHINNEAHGIIILTQIGELSINISSDYILTDICPIDRLVQRFGRGSRFDKSICFVDVVIPMKNDVLYPAPYGHFDKELFRWIPNEIFVKTCDAIKVGEYNVKNYIDIINNIYDKFELDSSSRNNAYLLKTLFKKNSIICSDSFVNDDENTVSWKSRNIQQQGQIYIGDINVEFENINDFEYDLFMNTISISVFNLKKLQKEIIETEITILNSNKKILVNTIPLNLYDNELGVKYKK